MFTIPKDESLDDGMTVTVVFRIWNAIPEGFDKTREGEVIALFPFVPGTVTNSAFECSCFQRGEHGDAEYMTVVERTRAVDEDGSDALAVRAVCDAIGSYGYTLSAMSHEQACFEAGRASVLKEQNDAATAGRKF